MAQGRRDGQPANPANYLRNRRYYRAKAEAFRRYGTDCWICGHPNGLEGDHVIRITDGGNPFDPDNIRPAHGSNYPCPAWPECRSAANPAKRRCCNQERNRRTRIQPADITTINLDPNEL